MTVWMLITAFHVGYSGAAVVNLGDFATESSCLFARQQALSLAAPMGYTDAKCIQVVRPK